jgi:hypothetical protein
MKLFLTILLALSARSTLAQQAPAAPSQDQPRIFITDSNSWETRSSAGGGANASGGGFFASSAGGARPQTAEVIKTFGQRCPQVLVNNRPLMSDYVVELDHEGGKGLLTHKDKIAVFVRTSGDSIFSKSTLSVGGSVQEACTAITAHWAAHAADLKAAALAAAAPPPPPAPIVVQTSAASTPSPGVSVDATVPNCDIQVDGDFVGNTPSVITLTPGKHQIAVTKTNYQPWTRTITFTGGTVHLDAEMVTK